MDDTRFKWSKEAAIYGLAAVAMLFFSMMLTKSWEQIRATRLGVEALNHTLSEYMSKISVAEYQLKELQSLDINRRLHELDKRITTIETTGDL